MLGVFEAENLSSMLHGAGAHIGKEIKMLATHQQELKALIHTGLKAQHISHILSSAGLGLGKQIEDLYESRDSIADILSGHPEKVEDPALVGLINAAMYEVGNPE